MQNSDKMHTEIKTGKGTFVLLEIPSDGVIFVADMGYLIFKTPAIENWVTDKELWDPVRLDKYLTRTEGKDQWKQAAIKIPVDNYKLLAVTKSFLADRHESSQNLTESIAEQIVDNNGMGCFDNYRLKRDEKFTCTTAMDSFQCLLLASGIDEQKTYAILKKL